MLNAWVFRYIWTMSDNCDFAVGQGVQVYPGSSDERVGVVVEDVGDCRMRRNYWRRACAEPSRRWAIDLDDGSLIFADTTDLQDLNMNRSGF